ELRRQSRARSPRLVLEEHKRLFPRLARQAPRPALELARLVLDAAQLGDAPVRRRDEGTALDVGVVDAKRRASSSQRREHVVGEPGRVAELEGEAPAFGQQREKI